MGAVVPSASARPATFDAALALLRAWADERRAAAPEAPVLDILRVAEALEIAWPVASALRGALPEAAAAMLIDPILAQERARAERVAEQAREAAEALAGAGLSAIALKGAAFLADAGGAPVPWRRLVDLDLLVDADALPRAVRALEEVGYAAADPEAYVPTDYHFPALTPARPGVAIELHTRMDWRRHGPMMRALEGARASALPGLRVLTPDDRLAHLVRHAQVSDRGWPRRRVRLREALDWRRLLEAGATLEGARRRMDGGAERAAFDGYAALMGRIWEDPSVAARAASRAWAQDALAAAADPELAARRDRADFGRGWWDAVTTWETLVHGLRAMLNPARLRRIVRNRT
ncbi:MAG: nucleotidyltransferase family protein [Pseudomonadota bacterium]